MSDVISNAGGNWADTAAWQDGTVPTAADAVTATGTSGNVTVAASGSVCRSIDFTGYVGTFTCGVGRVLMIGDGSGGSLTLVSGMTATFSSVTSGFSLVSTTTGNTVTTAGKTLKALTFNGAGGGWTLQDDVTIASGSVLRVDQGTLNLNGKSISISGNGGGSSAFRCLGASAAVLNMGASVVTLSGTGGWDASGSGLTLNCGTSTIILSDVTVTTKTFIGGGKTYATVTLSGDNITITGSNTFGTLNVNGAGLATGLLLTAGTTQTVTTLASSGTTGNVAKLASATPSTPATIAGPTQTVTGYLSVTDITYTGGTLYLPNGVDGGRNSGIVFSNPPSNAPSTPTGIALGIRIGI